MFACHLTGEALNIDPRGFYNTLYTKLLQVHVGKCAKIEKRSCFFIHFVNRALNGPCHRILLFWVNYVLSYTFLAKCPPTPPLSLHFVLSEK